MADAISFLKSVQNGIYFDRCIDLTFYDENMNPKGYLKTPEVGYKPDIKNNRILYAFLPTSP